MAVIVNSKGVAHAKSLIAAGKIDENGSWSFDGDDGNALLGSGGDDWTNYASYFLAEDTSATEKTKGRYKYPFGKSGKVFRAGVAAIRSRASAQDETAVFNAAGELMDELKKKDESAAARDGGNGILISCNDIVVDPATKQLPTEIDALIEGHHGRKTRQDGKIVDVVFTASDIDAAVAHVRARRERHPGRDFVIDYEHQTLTGNEAPAAGWYSDLYSIVRDGKKVARAKISQWTKHGAERILAGEYRYASPVFVQNGLDKETGNTEPLILKNIGLTNEPFIDGLLPVAAKSFLNDTTIMGKDTVMDETMSWLRSFLNLPLTATPQDILTELNKLAAQIQASIGATAATTAKDLLTYLGNVKSEIAAKANLVKVICGKDTGTVEEATAVYVTAKGATTELLAMKEELATLKNAQVATAFEGVITKAFTDGKILPAQKSDAAWLDTQKAFAMKDMTAFTAFWDKQPKIAPTGALPQTEPSAVAAKDDLSAEALEIGAKVGLTKETMIKFGK